MPIFSTMSTISDSVLGMGGSEPGGSVRQPMEEREVVPFGDSSLRKKVPREVSDNGSSSFERLMNFKHTLVNIEIVGTINGKTHKRVLIFSTGH